MQEQWTEIRKKPVQIGCSRGFIIDKKDIHLKSDEKYVVRVIPLSQFEGGEIRW